MALVGKRGLAALAVGLGIAGSAASAATLDFVAYAAGNEHSIASGTTLNFGGLNVTFTSNYRPYFDDLSGGPGGLGVCETSTAPYSCAGSSDDNVTRGEWVTLSFDRKVSLSNFSFSDNDHYSLNSSTNTFLGSATDGAFVYTPLSYNFAGLVAGSTVLLDSITFAWGGDNPSDFYLNSVTATPTAPPVPVPAAGLLLASGLGGVAALKRRRKAA